jgi:hypothetical protein
MRAVFLLVVVVVVALPSVVLANEPPRSIASRPLGGEALASDPPREASAVVYRNQVAGEVTAAEPAPPIERGDPSEPPKKTTISLTSGQFIFDHAPGTPGCMIAPGHKATIVCDAVTFTTVPGEWPKLHCKVCEVTLPSGATGTAAEVVYDAASRKLTLIGSEEEPIRLVSKASGESMSAAKLDIELKFGPVQPLFQIPTPAAYIETGEPFGPATSIAPNPIHRTDKALIAE